MTNAGFPVRNVVTANVLKSHVGEVAGAVMRSPFPAWDWSFFRTLTRDAGRDNASAMIEVGLMRYPSAEEFIRREAASPPLAGAIAAVEQEVGNELVQEAENRLEAYIDDEGIVRPH